MMMLLRPRSAVYRASRVVLLLVIVGASSGCSEGSHEPNALRTFETNLDGRWIGNAVSYGPHRDGQRPGAAGPSEAELREDLHLMAAHWNLLRVYSSSEFSETLLSILSEDRLPMKVVLGVWIAPEAVEANQREVKAAIRLSNAYPDQVMAVSVGNETQIFWSAHRSSLDSLISHVRSVRAGVTVPVTVADDFNFWNKPESQRLDPEIDFVMMHAHPMWNGTQLDGAIPWLQTQVEAVQAMHPDRPLVVGETGWATSVHDQGEQANLIKGRAGDTEQKQFYDEVRAWALARRLPVFFFEAFDENWKGGEHPDEVEKHWGVFRVDRSPKAAVAESDAP